MRMEQILRDENIARRQYGRMDGWRVNNRHPLMYGVAQRVPTRRPHARCWRVFAFAYQRSYAVLHCLFICPRHPSHGVSAGGISLARYLQLCSWAWFIALPDADTIRWPGWLPRATRCRAGLFWWLVRVLFHHRALCSDGRVFSVPLLFHRSLDITCQLSGFNSCAAAATTDIFRSGPSGR